MYIEKLEIKGFGKIKNLTLELKRGLNIIYGQNESGKTSIQWFIKGMLFGLKGGRANKDGAPPPLRRFKPWNGSSFGGAIEYRLDNGEFYRVERNFENGSVSVYDSFFNDITGTFAASRENGIQFAEQHLGMNEMCFDRTVFIRQMETRIDDEGSRELLNRLVNISQTGFEDVSFRKAEKALKDALKNYVGTDKTSTRPLDKVVDRLQELKEIRKGLIDKKNSLFNIENELKQAAASRKHIEDKRAALLKVRELIEIKREAEKYRKQEAGLKEVLDDIANAEKELEEARSRFEGLHKQKGRFNKSLAGGRINTAGYMKKLAGYSMAIFSALTVFFTVLGFLKSPWAFIAAILSLLIAVLVVLLGNKASGQLSGLTEDQEELSKLNMVRENIMNEIIEKNNDLKDMYSRASFICGRPLEDSRQIIKVLDEVSKTFATLQEKLKKGIFEIKSTSESAGIQCIGEDRFDRRLSDAELKELQLSWEREYSRVDNEWREVLLKVKEWETLLKSLAGDDDEIQRIDEEIAELELRKTWLEELSFSLKTALELLTASSIEIQRDFVPALNCKMSHIIDKISGGRYRDLRADDKLALKAAAPETGEVTAAVLLSGGTADQMYLALRLAAAELIAPADEKLPFIMDEVFAQYDDIRTEEFLKFLSELSSDRQIILFTCKTRETDIAGEVCGSGLNLINLSI